MKNMILIFFLLFIFIVDSKCTDSSSGINQHYTVSQNIQNSDLRIVKYNPVQVVFGELPVSWEVFKSERKSVQIQLGVLIPYARRFLPDLTTFLQSTGLVSYRNLPAISYGISFKVEFRVYRNMKYFAFQGMYKYSAFNKVGFTVSQIDGLYESFKQIESKNANVIGLGFMFGKHIYNDISVQDWYWGLGLRFRKLDGFITAKEYPQPAGLVEMYRPFSENSIYPFINMGVRFGRIIQMGR